MGTVIKVENLSKQYRLGEVGTGTLRDDFKRFRYRLMGKEDPFLQIGEVNDRSQKSSSDYVWALKDINFGIEQGDVVGIIGRNGAGKSTLLKILSRTTAPTTGSVKVKGRISSLLEVGTGFHGELSGRENIYLNGAILGLRKWEINKKLDEIIDFAGVEKYLDTPVKRYSSGMYVRLAFSVAAHLEPDILIVDEVLAVGDIDFQQKCLGKIKDVNYEKGRTVLFVSHNIPAIISICNTGIILKNGLIVSQDKINHIISEYNHMDLAHSDCLQKEGTVDLINKSNKKNKTSGLLKVTSFCNKVQSSIVFPGSNFELVIDYSLDVDLVNGEIGFVIKDMNEVSYIGLNNIHLGERVIFRKGYGKILIAIEDFPLYADGDYWINLYFGDSDSEYEIIENAILIKVISNDIYKSGRLLDVNYNKITHRQISIINL
jgi:lipopolysaccharide transport system ATP-binding protein